MKTNQKEKLKAVTGMEEIPFVSEGIATEASGFLVSEDGLTRIAEQLEAADVSAASLTQTQQSLEQVQAQLTTATESLNARTQELATATSRIQELEARVTELENEATLTSTSRQEDGGGSGRKAFHESDANPANKLADSLLGKPKPKE
jgi:polyhydroxyalkanoate synthesis regulator phasin